MPSIRSTPFHATIRIGLLAVSALTVFGVTALICAVPLLWFNDTIHASARLLSLGVVCGLIAWLVVAIFHIRRESLTLLDDHREVLSARLQRELEKLGYEAGEPHKGCTVFQPRFSAYLVGGALRVTDKPEGVVVTGPNVFVQILSKRMKTLRPFTQPTAERKMAKASMN